jgi:hypothetical protein
MTHAANRRKWGERPLDWFKCESDFFENSDTGPLTRWQKLLYLGAICATAQRRTPCCDRDMAWYMREPLEDIQREKFALVEAGLVSDEWIPTDWHERQPSPVDRTKLERQKRWRIKHKGARDASQTSPRRRATARGKERREEEKREEKIRGEDAPSLADAHDGNGIGSASPVHLSKIEVDSLLPDPFQGLARRSKARSRTDADFEQVLDRIEKAIVEGGLDPRDHHGLARVTGYSQKQASVAVQQLRDRNRLPP